MVRCKEYFRFCYTQKLMTNEVNQKDLWRAFLNINFGHA
jgi:hypothetical protein